MLFRSNANLTAKNGQGDTCLSWAAFRGYTAVVNWLLDQGVAIDEPNNSGNTALMVACGMGHLEVAQLLANRNANLTEKNRLGQTCLIRAAAGGHTATVSWLLAQGASPDEPDHRQQTPLHHAVEKKCWHVVNVLLEYEANLNLVMNLDNGTVLGDAIAEGAARDGH